MRPAGLLLALVACAVPAMPHPRVDDIGAPRGAGWRYAVTIDTEVPRDQALAVLAALDEWRAAVPGLTFDVDQGPVPARTSAAHALFFLDVPHEHMPPHLRARTGRDDYMDTAYVELDETRPSQQAAAAHEIGHAMGLAHTPHGVMCQTDVCASSRVEACDAAQFLATRN